MWKCLACGENNSGAFCLNCGAFPATNRPSAAIQSPPVPVSAPNTPIIPPPVSVPATPVSKRQFIISIAVAATLLVGWVVGLKFWRVEKDYYDSLTPRQKREIELVGPKPTELQSGLTFDAQKYFKLTLHDYDSMEVVIASPIEKDPEFPYLWTQDVRIRSKNGFGAFIVTDYVFYSNSLGFWDEGHHDAAVRLSSEFLNDVSTGESPKPDTYSMTNTGEMTSWIRKGMPMSSVSREFGFPDDIIENESGTVFRYNAMDGYVLVYWRDIPESYQAVVSEWSVTKY